MPYNGLHEVQVRFYSRAQLGLNGRTRCEYSGLVLHFVVVAVWRMELEAAGSHSLDDPPSFP